MFQSSIRVPRPVCLRSQVCSLAPLPPIALPCSVVPSFYYRRSILILNQVRRREILHLHYGKKIVKRDRGAPQGRVQLRSVPSQRHVGATGRQASQVPQDGNYHRRPHLQGKQVIVLLLSIVYCKGFSLTFWFQDGVILGADTRATEGEIVCDKNCEKIHYLAPNISCCGAGTAADTENVTGSVLRLIHYFALPVFALTKTSIVVSASGACT